MSLKTVLKVLGRIGVGFIALLIVAVGAVYGISSHKMKRKHAVRATPIAVANTPENIERGKHIVATRACGDCHGADFGGAKVIDDPMAGLLHGANLTHGSGGLPADYADIDYVRAIRHGVARDGRALVLMPSSEYASLSDEDLGAVIAYLKTVAPVDRPRGEINLGPALRALIVAGQVKLAADEIDHSISHVASVTPAITPEYGKYLASSCTGCHGPNLAGGKITGAPPDWPAAANLTPHESSHLKHWNEAQFVEVLRTQQRPDGSKLNPVMPAAFARMSDAEIKALWAYFTSLPPAPTGSR